MKFHNKIGVLAYHGDVIEHKSTAHKAIKNLRLSVQIQEVRTKNDLDIDGLIIPGGESTVLHKLSEREGIFELMKQIRFIFGTCAGAIMLAKKIYHKTSGQKTLQLMDIEVDRNAYGRQTDSFEKKIHTVLGDIQAVFIRAPRIKTVGKNVKVLARDVDDIIACEEKCDEKFYLAACFHPELTTTVFHEYFLRRIYHLQHQV
ncbi:pyridoxal 5'-phosphate synthase glutaminase subunit PdxT [Candidatus Gottesmanbacteria bacterium]|nr:pyridoxal 5'-phosphate synthase glutaminase subunit PdxT [Candidatus Gottesmanbacteria bacterium]